MRWPLRNQILLPIVCLMLAALVGVSLFNAYLSIRRTRLQIEANLAQVTQTLARSNFPLTDAVLQQMRGFAGAEFALTNTAGDILAASGDHAAFADLPAVSPAELAKQTPQSPTLGRRIRRGEQWYFHSAVPLRRLDGPAATSTLHILYPEESYVQAWRDVAYPPLLVGGIALVLVIGFGLGIASRVTRPLGQLQRQVEEIAEGKFRSVPVPKTNDEIADLSRSVNQMAEMLAHYETEVRRNERLRTLGQLGGGIAHQMRNSVTGCRMAIELHARECTLDEETLEVAKRQLRLMEKYLQRFLALGKTRDKPHQRMLLQPVIDNVVMLVGPTANHVGVELNWQPPSEQVAIHGDPDTLEQLLVNLVLNGIEAAAAKPQDELENGKPPATLPSINATPNVTPSVTPAVFIQLKPAATSVSLEIVDTGTGPAVGLDEQVFEPFITEKPDGTGLGLAVAQEVAHAHQGEITWHRAEGKTYFVVTLPLASNLEPDLDPNLDLEPDSQHADAATSASSAASTATETESADLPANHREI